MMIGDSPETSITNMLLCKQILFRQLILCSIRGSPFLFTPIVRKRIAIEAVFHIAEGRIELFRRDMTPIDVRNLIGIECPSQVSCHLVGAEIRSIREKGQ